MRVACASAREGIEAKDTFKGRVEAGRMTLEYESFVLNDIIDETLRIISFQSQDRNIEDTDIVVWYTFGVTHLVRPEDFPVMPVEYTGFLLSPFGFFDRNPALDIPPTSGSGSCHA